MEPGVTGLREGAPSPTFSSRTKQSLVQWGSRVEMPTVSQRMEDRLGRRTGGGPSQGRHMGKPNLEGWPSLKDTPQTAPTNWLVRCCWVGQKPSGPSVV